MKKMILAIGAAALVLGATACSKTASGVSAEEKALGDSISNAMGSFMGARFGDNLRVQQQQNPEEAAKMNISAVMRGMETVLYADTTDLSYLTGVSIGMSLMQQVMNMTQNGIAISPEAIMKGFKSTVDLDSVDVQQYFSEFQRLQKAASAAAEKRQEAARAAEAEKNEAAGTAYVDSVKAADSAVQTSESGLSYKIENPGEGEKVKSSDRIKLNYVGRTTDGKIFDQTNGNPRETSAGVFIPGFNEGLQLLGKGGKATIYIPGKLAYGERGIPQAGIGPNSTLIFDIEVVDIIPAE